MGSTIQNPLVLIPLLTIVLGLLIYFLSSPVIPEDELHRCIEDFTIPTSQNATFEYDLADRDVSPELLNQILEESATPNIKPVNDFKATEVNDGIGADLIQAFKIPDVPGITADLVNTNKNNVSKYNAKDYLPKEINEKWFDTDFSQAKFNINDDKLINTQRYIIGINTVGQSLKNASYDIRGTIPNPKFSVSPWNNSTYEPDYNIKPLC